MKIIVHSFHVECEANVESSSPGAFYRVGCVDGVWYCTCPDHKLRERICKHIRATQKACSQYDLTAGAEYDIVIDKD